MRSGPPGLRLAAVVDGIGLGLATHGIGDIAAVGIGMGIAEFRNDAYSRGSLSRDLARGVNRLVCGPTVHRYADTERPSSVSDSCARFMVREARLVVRLRP